MTLQKRLAKLEQAQNTSEQEPQPELVLPPDLRERIEVSYAAGLKLGALSIDDLDTILAAPIKERGKT